MVQAGKPVDEVIGQLVPLLDKGDILIDGGNSYFLDTIRRAKDAEAHGLLFLGAGVSGGEEGALKGPSIMPGGHRAAYDAVEKDPPRYLRKGRRPALLHVHRPRRCRALREDGPQRHRVRRHAAHLRGLLHHEEPPRPGLPRRWRTCSAAWNKGDLDSFLIEITADILGREDPETKQPMVEVILDTAGQKGTGKWTSQSALDLGVAAPTVAEAVFARCISAMKSERVAASKILHGPTRKFSGDPRAFVDSVHDALYASKICSYAQGFSLLAAAAAEQKWDLNFGEIAMIWRGGCIIRAKFLGRIKEAYDRTAPWRTCCSIRTSRRWWRGAQEKWRRVVAAAAELRRSHARVLLGAVLLRLAIAPSACRRISSRRSATTSARTPTSASIGPASSTPNGCANETAEAGRRSPSSFAGRCPGPPSR